MDLHPRLDSIPLEIMDNILTLLKLSDICSLRLAGREVNARSSQSFFQKPLP